MAATKIEEKNFTSLKADVNRLFTLESSQLTEQDNLAVAQGNVALDLINVYRALGGGWQIRDRDGHSCQARITDVVPEPEPPAAEPQQLPPPRPAPRRP